MSTLLSGWLLAPSVSTYGPGIDHLYNIVLVLTAIVFVLTEAALVLFCFRYRARPGQAVEPSHGSTKAEIIWTTIPALIMITLGFMSQNLWAKLRPQAAAMPAADVTVQVSAEQWLWNFRVATPTGEIDTQNEVHIPVNQRVRFELSAKDVIHGFYIPDLRINQDTVPGITSSIWVQATRTGQFEIRCTQFCGTNHYQMKGRLTVDSPEDYQAWLNNAKAEAF